MIRQCFRQVRVPASARAQVLVTLALILAMSGTPSTSGAQTSKADGIIRGPNGEFFVGDKLRVAFFESLTWEKSDEKTLANLVERAEMSGEYTIGQGGMIHLPFLGGFQFSGRSQEEVELGLAREFRKRLNGNIQPVIQILSREPVYIVSSYGKSSQVKHIPGMTVLHAMALAGGVEGIGGDEWRHFEMSREKERQVKSEERLKRQLARFDILMAERAGLEARPSARLIRSAGERLANELINSEDQLRLLENARRTSRLNAFSALANTINLELDILNQRRQHSEETVAEKAKRMKPLAELRARAVITDTIYQSAQSELSSARERWHEVRAAIAQVERRLVEIEQQVSQVTADVEVEREQEIRSLTISTAEEELTIQALSTLLSKGLLLQPLQDREAISTVVTILRRLGSGVVQLTVGESAPIVPGDLLRIHRDVSDARADATSRSRAVH